MLGPPVDDDFAVDHLASDCALFAESLGHLGETEAFPHEEEHSFVLVAEQCLFAKFHCQ